MYYLLAEKLFPPPLLLTARAKGGRFLASRSPPCANTEEPRVGGGAEGWRGGADRVGGAIEVFV